MLAIKEVLNSLEQDSSNLIKALQLVQEKEGYVSDEAIQKIADYFDIPPIEVEGVVTFYTQFKRSKPGKHIICVCDGTACHIKGSSLVKNWLEEDLGIKENETDAEGFFSLEVVACLGCCSLAPVVSIDGKVYGNLDRKKLLKIIKEYRSGGAE